MVRRRTHDGSRTEGQRGSKRGRGEVVVVVVAMVVVVVAMVMPASTTAWIQNNASYTMKHTCTRLVASRTVLLLIPRDKYSS
jgi:hypothetical protein